MQRRAMLVTAAAAAARWPSLLDAACAQRDCRRAVLPDRLPGRGIQAPGTRGCSSRSARPPSRSSRACAQTEGFTLPRQHNTFYYLSGIETPGAYLLLDGRTRKVTIYLPARNPRLEAAEGRVLSAEDVDLVKRISGADEVQPLRQMVGTNWPLVAAGRRGRRRRRRAARPPAAIFAEFSPAENLGQSRGELVAAETARVNDFWDGTGSRQRRFVELLRARHPRAEVREPQPDPRRDAEHQEPARDRDGAARLADRRPRPDGGDAQHRARRHRIPARRRGALRLPRSTTRVSRATARSPRAAPRTSTTCTTSATPSTLKDGDLVLMDYAPDYRYYVSDIGRVWPVNGKYTAQQRELLQFVLEFHKAVLSRIRPGVTATQIHDEAKKAMEPVFARTKFSKPIYEKAARTLVESGGGVFSHTVGMAVHDVGGYRNGPLKPGQVFSIDPQLRVPRRESLPPLRGHRRGHRDRRRELHRLPADGARRHGEARAARRASCRTRRRHPRSSAARQRAARTCGDLVI